MKEKIDFIIHNEKNWGDKQQQVSDTLCRFLTLKESFNITFTHIKTPKQLRAYWRLIDLVAPFMIESHGFKDKDQVSNFVKMQCDYFLNIKTSSGYRQIVYSLSDANKTQLSEMIAKLLFMCEYIGIENYELDDEEKKYLDENIIKSS